MPVQKASAKFQGGSYITFSKGIAAIDSLSVLLGYNISYMTSPTPLGVIGWGNKRNTLSARKHAELKNLSYLSLEDGFIRSVGLGHDDPPVSIVIDDQGIYYDANRVSRFESLMSETISDADRLRAIDLRERWKLGRISKYNHAREATKNMLPDKYVLVIDQTFGDMSITCGMATSKSFEHMLQCATNENPDCKILLKIHPDVIAGKKRGHFNLAMLKKNPRIVVFSADAHPPSLIEHADAIYVVTSQMGFEGLLWGKRVRTFGMPFYAGWGLTEDSLQAPTRRYLSSMENLIFNTLVRYPRYIDPETKLACDVEKVMDWISLQRKNRERFPSELLAINFSAWKKPILRSFLQGSSLKFGRKNKSKCNMEVHWGSPHQDKSQQKTRVSVEDGFIRSVGLGADLVAPLSWVLDDKGIYYDARKPSSLENILLTAVFDTDQIERARNLRQRIVTEKITKYNVGNLTWNRPLSAKKVILVPGQVESDASIKYGSPQLRNNLDLIKEVRKRNREAYVIYKPHPDVVAGLRHHDNESERILELCNEVIIDATMGQLLEVVDEVHVMTSLAGFEALLRDKHVVCYGQPFYAGWGLTEDNIPISRRIRSLTLDELVVGVLILYPTYISRTTGKFTTPERALEELLLWKEEVPRSLPILRQLWRWSVRLAMKAK